MMNVNSLRKTTLALIAAWLANQPGVFAFGGIESIPTHLVHDVGAMSVAAKTSLQDVQTLIASAAPSGSSFGAPSSSFAALGSSLFQSYKQLLAAHPLATKMATGGTLAVVGDAIAQSREVDEEYDATRAASFCVFDMSYRALQHFSYPVIVNQCHGQYLGGLVAALLSMSNTDFAAALEETLVAQLVIIPFLYYPVYFSLTGYMQGLTLEGSIERAQEKFLPLMQRNLLFWIPVQLVQFGFIEENLQVPFLSCAGLVWTFILSVVSGSTSKYSSEDEQESPFDEAEVIEKMNEQGYVNTGISYEEEGGARQKAFGFNSKAYMRQMDTLVNESMEKAATK